MIKYITVEDYFKADKDRRPEVTYRGKKVLDIKYELFSQDVRYRIDVQGEGFVEEEGFLLPNTKLDVINED